MSEKWKEVWRLAQSHLSDAALSALATGLREDDPNLIQEFTTIAPEFSREPSAPVIRACVLGYCGWKGEGLKTVSEVEHYFADLVRAVDRGHGLSCRFFTGWYDGNPRAVVFPALLTEVEAELEQRHERSRVDQTA